MIPEYEKSFANHPKSEFWSLKNSLKPYEVTMNSHKKFLFNCPCGHEFESNLNNINSLNNWCPFCSNKKICNNCNSCFQKSFASHNKSAFWSEKNIIKPNLVMKGTEKKYYFNCNCGHEILMSLKNITSKNHWCSYCSHQKLCENSNCNMCFNNSFASIEKSKYLNDKTINPRKIFKSTNKKFDFYCENCDKVFETYLSDITNGVWCSHCLNKTEKILYDNLIKIYSTLQRQYKVKWCKKQNYLPFDFVIEERKIIVELDGKQHFEQIGNWPTPQKTKINDLYKIKCANENGYSIIRILQKNVYYNKYNWLDELCGNIEKITNENIVQNIYMCKKDEYKDFELGL